jgi:hypothetical protein
MIALGDGAFFRRKISGVREKLSDYGESMARKRAYYYVL